MASSKFLLVPSGAPKLVKSPPSARASGPVKSLSPCPLHAAVLMLNNNAVRTMEEKGGRSLTTVTYPPELLLAARGLFPAGRVYQFEVHASATLASIGGGVFNTVIGWNPGTTTYSEWAALAALFDEVVLHQTTLEVTSAFGPTSTAIVFQVSIAPDGAEIAGTTPTFSASQRLAESEVIHCYNMGRSSTGRFRKVHRIPQGREFALTSAPGGASGINAGCRGNWTFASNIAGTASINYLFATVKNVLKLRLRA